MEKQYGVFCQVSGGVTGYRAAWLKSNGKMQVFASRELAEIEAKRLTEKRMNNTYRTADYHYSAREI